MFSRTTAALPLMEKCAGLSPQSLARWVLAGFEVMSTQLQDLPHSGPVITVWAFVIKKNLERKSESANCSVHHFDIYRGGVGVNYMMLVYCQYQSLKLVSTRGLNRPLSKAGLAGHVFSFSLCAVG
ncbi:hypothetical protein [Yoonia vestfoldensis]|uniref:hypothetical protein n=1 Tax=Yoonia vestfoldensis TaxID=245188 RepID=UPI0013A52CCA|nr:hypothetical protein [Yoonia vestfoldensis]